MSDRAFKMLFGALAPEKEISRETWLKILTYYLDRIKPHLESFSLKPLCEHSFRVYDKWIYLQELLKQNVSFDNLEESVLRRLLETQGLFFVTPRHDTSQIKKEKNQVERVLWGISRNGNIVIITLFYKYNTHANNTINPLFKVSIKTTKLSTILDYYPEKEGEAISGPSYLLSQIGNVITKITDKRLEIYNKVKNLDDDLQKISEILFYTSNYKDVK